MLTDIAGCQISGNRLSGSGIKSGRDEDGPNVMVGQGRSQQHQLNTELLSQIWHISCRAAVDLTSE